jgi:uncharacterized membrane protein YbhN (UPF0104 family)
VAKAAAVAAVVWFVVWPLFRDARDEMGVVADVHPVLLVAGVALQVNAYVAHAQLVRTLLPRSSRPSLGRMLRIELAARAASHTIPAGTAAGAALSFRLLQRSGVSGPDAGFASGAQAIGSTGVLHIITWCALALSIPLHGFQPLYAVAAAAGLGLALTAGASIWAATGGEDRVAWLVGAVAGRLPLVDADTAIWVIRRVSERLRWFIDRPALVARTAGWSALHWLSDAASLWLILAGFGQQVPLDVLLVAFGLSSMLASIPVTPRGLGFVEVGLTALLQGYGLARGPVALGVVAYRLVSFWIPIPLGGVSYLTLEIGSDRRSGRRRVV